MKDRVPVCACAPPAPRPAGARGGPLPHRHCLAVALQRDAPQDRPQLEQPAAAGGEVPLARVHSLLGAWARGLVCKAGDSVGWRMRGRMMMSACTHARQEQTSACLCCGHRPPQAQQYEWLLQDYPGLFSEIQAAAGRGSFVPVGGAEKGRPWKAGNAGHRVGLLWLSLFS